MTWHDIYDITDCDHALEVFAEWFDAEGKLVVDATAARTTIVKNLLEPITQAQRKVKVPDDALNRFMSAVDELIWIIGNGPTLPRRVRVTLAELRLAWLEYIAHGAGPKIYSNLPKTAAKNRRRAKLPRPKRQKVDHEDAKKYFESLLKGGTSEKQARSMFRAKYGGDLRNAALTELLKKISAG